MAKVNTGLPPLKMAALVIGFASFTLGVYWTIFIGYWTQVDLVLPVYPSTMVLAGLALVAFAVKFGDKAIPLFAMGVGGLDFLERIPETFIRLAQTDSAIYGQALVMVLGWLLAGRPSFRINRWFWVAGAIYALVITTRLYQLFAVAFYVYLLTSTRLSTESTT